MIAMLGEPSLSGATAMVGGSTSRSKPTMVRRRGGRSSGVITIVTERYTFVHARWLREHTHTHAHTHTHTRQARHTQLYWQATHAPRVCVHTHIAHPEANADNVAPRLTSVVVATQQPP
jgi:hypothetical protein